MSKVTLYNNPYLALSLSLSRLLYLPLSLKKALMDVRTPLAINHKKHTTEIMPSLEKKKKIRFFKRKLKSH